MSNTINAIQKVTATTPNLIIEDSLVTDDGTTVTIGDALAVEGTTSLDGGAIQTNGLGVFNTLNAGESSSFTVDSSGDVVCGNLACNALLVIGNQVAYGNATNNISQFTNDSGFISGVDGGTGSDPVGNAFVNGLCETVGTGGFTGTGSYTTLVIVNGIIVSAS